VKQSAAHEFSWSRGWDALLHYVAVRGSAGVPPRAISGGVDLGRWADSCRERYWSGELAADQVAALQVLPGWSWEGAAAREWHRTVSRLCRCAAQHGGPEMLADSPVQGRRIGGWVRAQRDAYHRGALPADRITVLEQIPGWQWSPGPSRWELGVQILGTYLAQVSDADVPAGAVCRGFAVGRWVARQREDHRAGTLTAEQEQALTALPGWRWSSREERWGKGFAALTIFVQRHGHACPPQAAVVGTFRLGAWVSQVRRSFKNGTLPAAAVRAVQALPGWSWSPQQDAWDAVFQVLATYAEQTGDPRPARSARCSGVALGEWVMRQHQQHAGGRLSSERTAALESLSGWAWPHTRSWT